jgi:hypothetical protein
MEIKQRNYYENENGIPVTSAIVSYHDLWDFFKGC